MSSQQDCISLALRAPYGVSEASCPNFEPRAHARPTGLTRTSSAFKKWVRVRVLGYGFGVRGRKVKSRDCAARWRVIYSKSPSFDSSPKLIQLIYYFPLVRFSPRGASRSLPGYLRLCCFATIGGPGKRRKEPRSPAGGNAIEDAARDWPCAHLPGVAACRAARFARGMGPDKVWQARMVSPKHERPQKPSNKLLSLHYPVARALCALALSHVVTRDRALTRAMRA